MNIVLSVLILSTASYVVIFSDNVSYVVKEEDEDPFGSFVKSRKTKTLEEQLEKDVSFENAILVVEALFEDFEERGPPCNRSMLIPCEKLKVISEDVLQLCRSYVVMMTMYAGYYDWAWRCQTHSSYSPFFAEDVEDFEMIKITLLWNLEEALYHFGEHQGLGESYSAYHDYLVTSAHNIRRYYKDIKVDCRFMNFFGRALWVTMHHDIMDYYGVEDVFERYKYYKDFPDSERFGELMRGSFCGEDETHVSKDVWEIFSVTTPKFEISRTSFYECVKKSSLLENGDLTEFLSMFERLFNRWELIKALGEVDYVTMKEWREDGTYDAMRIALGSMSVYNGENMDEVEEKVNELREEHFNITKESDDLGLDL